MTLPVMQFSWHVYGEEGEEGDSSAVRLRQEGLWVVKCYANKFWTWFESIKYSI